MTDAWCHGSVCGQSLLEASGGARRLLAKDTRGYKWRTVNPKLMPGRFSERTFAKCPGCIARETPFAFGERVTLVDSLRGVRAGVLLSPLDWEDGKVIYGRVPIENEDDFREIHDPVYDEPVEFLGYDEGWDTSSQPSPSTSPSDAPLGSEASPPGTDPAITDD